VAVIDTLSNRPITTIQVGDAPQTLVTGRMARAADGRHSLSLLGTASEAASTAKR
jgi:hypothetical protein